MNKAPVSTATRAAYLFANFFLIILAYYQVKAASRGVYIEYLGADNLPYVWIGSPVFLVFFAAFYNRVIERYKRLHVVLVTTLVVVTLLVLFRYLLVGGDAVVAFSFYIFVDVFSVVLVEQLWSLANTVNTAEDGKRWYWFVGNGGLIGSLAGGVLTKTLLDGTAMHTEDLLLVAAVILSGMLALNLLMGKLGLYDLMPTRRSLKSPGESWRALFGNRYVLLIGAALLLSQLAQPVIEYQFANTLAANADGLDDITAKFGSLFTLIGLMGVLINVTLTPLVHRHLGAISGILVQPVFVFVSSLAFAVQPVFGVATTMKVGDRSLNYSINRTSKEQFYIPIDPIQLYQIKAWIDMFGYRAFKVLGSLIILILTKSTWLPFTVSLVNLSWVTMGICLVWILVIMYLAQEYRAASADMGALQPAG